MDELAIKIEHVSKEYRLGAIGGGTLKGDLQTWWARVRGKEDPNSRIGARTDIKIGERFLALDDINLEVKKGEALGIIGHNGAGKSTLLKLLCRVTAPTSGKISYDGRIASMLEVGTGFHPELTGRENIYMNGAILGMTRAEIDSKIEEIIDFSEVRQFIDTPVKRYSSGMYVKLAFSVAAHLDSEIMIMDEVLAVGDMAFQKKCLSKMREAADKEGRTVLYVSHNMNTIRQLCDRVVVLEHGSVIFAGDVEEGIRRYLGTRIKETQFRSFSESEHEKWCNRKLFISSLNIENNMTSLKCGDVLSFTLEYYSIEDIKEARFRLVLLNNYDTIIGMSNSEGTISINKGNEGKYRLSFNTDVLAAGKYRMRFSAYNINEYGSHEYICVINDFCAFELQDDPSLHCGMLWKTNSWGNIAFQSFQIEEI